MLHKVMMEEVLYGCDVMPSAVHITGATLSGVEPAVLFNKSRLCNMPCGRMKDGSVEVGLPGAAPILQRAGAVQHQRPGRVYASAEGIVFAALALATSTASPMGTTSSNWWRQIWGHGAGATIKLPIRHPLIMHPFFCGAL